MAINDEIIRLTLDLKKSGASQETIDTVVNYKKSLKDAEKATDELTAAQTKQAQGVMYLSNAFQDFQAAGLRGVLNNINQIATTFGMGGAFAGGLTFALVGIEALRPSITATLKSMMDGGNAIPKSTDVIEGYNNALKTNKDRLEELTKSQSLSNTELKEFNKLTAENVNLEKQLTAAKKERHVIEELMKMRAPGEEEKEKERAGYLAELGGRQKDILREVTPGMRVRELGIIGDELNRLQPAGKKLTDLPEATQQRIGQLRAYEASLQRGDMPESLRTRIRGTVGRAIVEGKEADIKTVLGALPEGSEFFVHSGGKWVKKM